MRIALALLAVQIAFGCGSNSCSCAAPLPAPMGDGSKVYDAVQTRITPAAFDFIQDNLVQIIGTFLAGGLSFPVPRMDETFCMPGIGWPCFDITICENTCVITASIIDASLARTPPDTLSLLAHVDVEGALEISNDIDCDVPLTIPAAGKPVHATITLIIDSRDHFLTFSVGGLDLSIENDDFDLQCSAWYDWLFELLKGVITDQLNSQIQDQLGGVLGDQMAAATCLPCDFYTLGCPTGSSCDGNGFCVDGAGVCLTKPQGMVGQVDLGALLASVSPGMKATLDVLVAPGQWLSAAADPVVPNDGVELRLIGGVDAPRNVCVVYPPLDQIPPNTAPPRLTFTDAVPGSGESYMAGIGISDVFLDWFLYKAYMSGLFCLSISTETTSLLSSGTLAALMGSLDTLTGGLNTPVFLKITPNAVPKIEIGAGTFTTDVDGNRTILDALVHLFLPAMSIDFYVLIDERYMRVATLTQDIALDVALDFTPDNKIVPVFDEESIKIDCVTATNYELLAEDPAGLEAIVPTLVGLALPALTGSIQPIELPALQGFLLDIQAVQGEMPRDDGTPYFNFIGLYANLSMAPTPPPSQQTRAQIAALNVPERRLMECRNPGGPQYPEVLLQVDRPGDVAPEFSYRVDGDFWRPFRPGPVLTVHDPLLNLVGRHTIEVRGRTTGDYRSLDQQPVVLTVDIQPLDHPDAAGAHSALDPIAPARAHPSANQALDQGEPRIGCATAGTAATPGLLFLLLGISGLMVMQHRRGKP